MSIIDSMEQEEFASGDDDDLDNPKDRVQNIFLSKKAFEPLLG
jgi:hypothetical protein